MEFIDSYKRLEKLCSEMYGDNHGLTAYIDEMKKIPNGELYVHGWDEDLKQLKHYRWIRNQISHEPGCSEENMCKSGDAAWLEGFYSRILGGTDPLTRYRKATTAKRAVNTYAKPPVKRKPEYPRYAGGNTAPKASQYSGYDRKSESSSGCAVLILGALILLAVAVTVWFANNT